MTSGPSAAASASRSATASSTRNRVRSPGAGSVASARSSRVCSSGASAAGPPRATSDRTTGSHGQNAGVAPPSNVWPQWTPAPRRRASALSSSSSRVFPMPGSPSTSTMRTPLRASSSAATADRSSNSRPTSSLPAGVPASRSGAVAAPV